MSRLFRTTTVLSTIVCLALAAFAAVVPAQSSASLDKHSRKVYNKLAKYPSGKYLHLVITNAPDAYGALGTLSAASFTFSDAESNKTATFRYSDVDSIKTDRQAIGKGSEPRRIKHLVPIVITAAAIAAGALTYEAIK